MISPRLLIGSSAVMFVLNVIVGYSDVEKSQIPKVNGVCDDCGSKEFNRRSDDNREVLEKRIEVYKDQTAHLIPFFKENYKLISVDGEQEITKVSEDIEIAMRSIQNKIDGSAVNRFILRVVTNIMIKKVLHKLVKSKQTEFGI